MATVIDLDVNVNERLLQDDLDRLCTDEQALLEIHNRLAQRCDKYVPFLTGALANSAIANITPQGVTYTTPYARYQYYGITFNHTTTYHPLASALWDKQMMINEGDEFIREITQILLRRQEEIYGY